GPERFEVEGYAAVAGSPVAAEEWIVPGVNTTGPGTESVVVFNPAAKPVEVTVDAVDRGRRQTVDRIELAAGDRTVVDLGDHEAHMSLQVTADGGVVVGQNVVGEELGLSANIASPIPGTVRTLPPPIEP